MASLLSAYNIPLLSIPAYHIFSLLPHVYAMHLARGPLPLSTLDNSSPRSSSFRSHLQSSLPPHIFARWERAEAATANAHETLPLYVAAVLAGLWAGVGHAELMGFIKGWFGLRALHAVVYVTGGTQATGHLRTAVWWAGVGWLGRFFLNVARVAA
ncbi:hypothetical protein EJ06DRAFT_475653 [Trichodelitschia bisporula]|uniref:Membrane-associated proteins in eicosanoid and glutathione metabolism n=1 Tax=Trichodelitschia bisporula TaxID=703511 RepID=A0A6G1HZY8_9PEZI|nr:hypothetical protein EJ06DRAFT_475653 [Trichodelitschia bisporula]